MSEKFSESNSNSLLQMRIKYTVNKYEFWTTLNRYTWLDHSIMMAIYSKLDLELLRDVDQISISLEMLLLTDRPSSMNLAKRLQTETVAGSSKKLGITSSSMMLCSKWYKTFSNHQPTCSAWFSLFNSRHFFEWRSQVVPNWRQPTPPWNSTFHKKDIRTGSRVKEWPFSGEPENGGGLGGLGISFRKWPHV